MSNIFDNVTKTMLTGNTPDYIGDFQYAIDPNMPSDVPYKYVKVVEGQKEFKGQQISTGIPEEMTLAEKQIVDEEEANKPVSPTVQYGASDEESRTSSTEWSDKVKLTTPIFPAGTFLLEWSAEIVSSKRNNPILLQVSIDGEIISNGGVDDKDWRLCSGIREVTLAQGAHSISLQYRVNNDSKTGVAAGIRRATLRMS